ncbi:SapC family protein [Asticcacaulis sp. ZE23SCel15]|uniref:SapC family protein n=1 Tax=Asticcacaulis sp. ZE23SCel15 TaxID=3059027 RepID=UPI00265E0D3F|nr:SapC family protein [Asticcacaulis sp. ZE23SCel15]WKL58957.1 SapC family protein [Asticcacaulis sp. ZE23SCel15]
MSDTVTNPSGLPLFYQKPQPLASGIHGALRIKDGDYGFAADTACIPLMLSEFAFAARDYPVLFAAQTMAPVALMGLQNQNLFVSDGAWDEDAYIPAYARRYPFSTLRLEEDKGFAMVLDVASPRVTDSADEGIALFEGDEPSAYTKQVLAFCEQFHADALMTEAFSEALKAQDLLIERRADIVLPDGEKLGVNGFLIIDPERFSALDESIITEWHRKGWLGIVHFHLASLERFQNLVKRQSRRPNSPNSQDKAA